MKIKEIKISDVLMMSLVDKFFVTEIVNMKRTAENAARSMKVASGEISMSSPEARPVPPLTVKVNSRMDISEELVERYFHEWRNFPRVFPHFSLVSDNAENDLQVYLTRVEDGVVNAEDLSCKTQYYELTNDKYYFINQSKTKTK